MNGALKGEQPLAGMILAAPVAKLQKRVPARHREKPQEARGRFAFDFRFKHLSAQWRRPLGLLLHVPGQLLQLLLLLGAELVRLGAEELFLKLGNLGSRLRQQLLITAYL